MLICPITICLLYMTVVAGNVPVFGQFDVIAFYTARKDPAHVSFVREAHRWFSATGPAAGFTYDSTNDWSCMNEKFLAKYEVVVFLDTRPEDPRHREAFQNYMERGGGWIGFHFAGFALDDSEYPQNWDWYHREFLVAGEYKGNTWRPTPATLRVENSEHPATAGLPSAFISAANEWYSWKVDIRTDPRISILLSIDPTSFPLGTGPKPHEIWHDGYYPVAWTNTKYRMVYINMGHNDMDYENGTGNELSSTFSSLDQNRFLLNVIKWVGQR